MGAAPAPSAARPPGPRRTTASPSVPLAHPGRERQEQEAEEAVAPCLVEQGADVRRLEHLLLAGRRLGWGHGMGRIAQAQAMPDGPAQGRVQQVLQPVHRGGRHGPSRPSKRPAVSCVA